MSYFHYDLDTGITNQLCENIITSITFRELFFEEFQYEIKDLINDELALYSFPVPVNHNNHSGGSNNLKLSSNAAEDYADTFIQSLSKKLEATESKFISSFETDLESIIKHYLSEYTNSIQRLDNQMNRLKTDLQNMLNQYSNSEIHRLLIEESAQDLKKKTKINLSSLEDRLIRRVKVTAEEVQSNLEDLLEKPVNEMAAEIHNIMDEKVKKLTRLTYSNIEENKIEDRVVDEFLQEVLSEDFLRQEIISPLFSKMNKQYNHVFKDLVKKEIRKNIGETVREQVEQSIRSTAISKGENLEQYYYSCIIDFVIKKLDSQESHLPYAKDIINERLDKNNGRNLEKIIENSVREILQEKLSEHFVVDNLISSEYFLDRLGLHSAKVLMGDIKTAAQLNKLLQKQTEKSYSMLLNNLISNPTILENLTEELSKTIYSENPNLIENVLQRELIPVIKEYISGIDSLEKILVLEKAINLSVVSKNSETIFTEVNRTLNELLNDNKQARLDIDKLQDKLDQTIASNNSEHDKVNSFDNVIQTMLIEMKQIKKANSYVTETIENLNNKVEAIPNCQVTLKDIVNCLNESDDTTEKEKLKKEIGSSILSALAENKTRDEMGILEKLLQKRAKKYELQNLLNDTDFQLIYREKLAQLIAEYQLSKWVNQNNKESM